MVQYRQPLLKAFQSKYLLQCMKKLRWASLFVLFIFSNAGSCLSKLDFKKCVIIVYFLSEFGRYADVEPT